MPATQVDPSRESLEPAFRRTPRYAGFWRRAVAFTIDFTLTSTIASLLSPAYGDALVDALFSGDLDATTLTSVLLGELIAPIISWLYWTMSEKPAAQATLGKRIVGIHVTDFNGDPLGFAQANRRFFAKSLSLLTLGLGFVMAAFNERKRALHDLVAGTLVVRD